MLVGLVLGLAIYNSVLLDFPLPIALYKKLVGQPPTLRDLSDMEPTVGKSLRELLNYSGARRVGTHLACPCSRQAGALSSMTCQNSTERPTHHGLVTHNASGSLGSLVSQVHLSYLPPVLS